MVEKLQPGRFHGHVAKSLTISDFTLTETVHAADSRWARHAHENSYFCFVLQGAYTERYGQREVVCNPATVTFRSAGETHEDIVHEAASRVFVVEISPRWIEKLRADSLTLRTTSEFCGGALPRCRDFQHGATQAVRRDLWREASLSLSSMTPRMPG
jgi:hypothetical protein